MFLAVIFGSRWCFGGPGWGRVNSTQQLPVGLMRKDRLFRKTQESENKHSSTCQIPINGLPVGIYSAIGLHTEWPILFPVISTSSPPRREKNIVKRQDTGRGSAKPEVLFTPHLCLHENTMILTDLGRSRRWGGRVVRSVSVEGSPVFAVKRKRRRAEKKERNSIVPRKIKPKAAECKGLQVPRGCF